MKRSEHQTCVRPDRLTSAWGKKRRFDPLAATSGLQRSTDIARSARLVRLVPWTDLTDYRQPASDGIYSNDFDQLFLANRIKLLVYYRQHVVNRQGFISLHEMSDLKAAVDAYGI